MNPYFKDDHVTLFNTDVLEGLALLPTASVQCVVTSPPYWGLRDYGVDGQIGLEKTPEEYIEKMVTVFREVRRVLKDDGILWLNMGDCYVSSPHGTSPSFDPKSKARDRSNERINKCNRGPCAGLPGKNLLMMPHRLALALQADGWYVRADNVWSKPNPMPESATDRCTRAHEYVFHLTKSAKYFYNADAIRIKKVRVDRETFRGDSEVYANQKGPQKNHWKYPDGWDTSKGDGGHGSYHKKGREKGKTDKQRGHGRRHDGFNDRWDEMTREEQQANGANKRSVWNIATRPYPEAHFATFPPELARICILAGSRVGDVVMDPFAGCICFLTGSVLNLIEAMAK